MDRATRKIVRDLLSLPTAPFHENSVQDHIRVFAADRNIPVRSDRYGNLILRYRKGRGIKPLALTAHMDHPGFEVLQAGGKDITAEWLGACDPRHFPGSKVTVISQGVEIPGKVTSPLVTSAEKDSIFSIRTQRPVLESNGAFGFWRLTPVKFDGDRILTKAADNLAGCAVILATLDRLHRVKAEANLYGVFTRAEEVGLLGAAGVALERMIPPRAPVLVLEASKALPGAEVGQGPVIRVGDKMSTFDPRVEFAIHVRAQELRKRKRSFRYQRQLMSGGVCEATLYLLHGMSVGALAFPLGNYHNLGKRWPAEEYISASDMVNMVDLCFAMTLDPPVGETRGPIRKQFTALFNARKKRLVRNRKTEPPDA